MGAWGLETPTEGRPDRSKPQHQPYLPSLGCANILDQSKIAGEEEKLKMVKRTHQDKLSKWMVFGSVGKVE